MKSVVGAIEVSHEPCKDELFNTKHSISQPMFLTNKMSKIAVRHTPTMHAVIRYLRFDTHTAMDIYTTDTPTSSLRQLSASRVSCALRYLTPTDPTTLFGERPHFSFPDPFPRHPVKHTTSHHTAKSGRFKQVQK